MQPTAGAVLGAVCLNAFLVQGARRKLIQGLAVLGLCALCIILPWMIRTQIVLHGWVPLIRDNFPLELSISFNDHTKPRFTENFAPGGASHPNEDIRQARLVASMGELEYMRMRGRQAVTWILGHPIRSVSLVAARIGYFWVPYRRSLVLRIPDAVLTASAFVGLFMLRRRRVAVLFA